MDLKLRAWGLRPCRSRLPRLWLFTDEHRLPDPRDSVARLPRGKAGVVLRHDSDPGRETLGRDLARICRQRRLVLVVAGDVRLAAALKAGVHLRAGRWPGPVRIQRGSGGVVTCSAHSAADLLRAKRHGVSLAFVSPAFPTASHPGAPALGPLRWTSMARLAPAGLAVAALGGIDGTSVRSLPARFCRAAGAIGALGVSADEPANRSS